jgi:tetratricopeptide (TPR) repeat protein
MLLANYVLGTEQLDRMLASDKSTVLNTDLDLRLEFDAPLHLFRELGRDEQVTVALAAASARDTKWTAQLAKNLGLAADSPDFFLALGDLALRQFSTFMSVALRPYTYYADRAASWYSRALALDPKNEAATKGIRGAQLRRDIARDPESALRELVALDPDDASIHAQLATVLLGKKQRVEAARHYREALRLEPRLSIETKNYTWANNLAWLLAASPEAELRDGPEALRWAQVACAIAGDGDPAAIDTLAAALAEVGRFQEAIATSKRIFAIAPEYTQLVESVQGRIKLYEKRQPYHGG